MKIRLRDVFTAPNVVTTTGLVGTFVACKDLTLPKNLALLASSRTLDIFDGALARKLNQSSDFGAGYDAVADKLALSWIIKSMLEQDVAPKSALTVVAARNFTNAALTGGSLYKDFSGQELRRNEPGGPAIAIETAALGSFAIANSLALSGGSEQKINFFNEAGWLGIGIGSFGYGVPATRGYVERYISHNPGLQEVAEQAVEYSSQQFLAHPALQRMLQT